MLPAGTGVKLPPGGGYDLPAGGVKLNPFTPLALRSVEDCLRLFSIFERKINQHKHFSEEPTFEAMMRKT